MLRDIADELAGGSGDRSARRIAAVIGRMISAGTIATGQRLPTVRSLARQLGVSPTTVSEAWRSLAAVGAITTQGRNGTVAHPPTGPLSPARYRRVTEGPGHFAIDLSTGTPDPDLLPDLGPILARVSSHVATSSYLDHPVLPELEAYLFDTWPFAPDAVTVVNGAMDAFDRICATVLHLGDRVIVEHPTFPPLLDLLDLLECEVIGVPIDAGGLAIAPLRAAADSQPRAVFLQPRAHNPTGRAMTAQRAREIADLFAGTATIFVEDDHANAIATSPLTSVGHWLPDRTVHVRSFSKSHGPDLRLAAIGGNGEIVARIENRRLLGPGWSSRILQAVLVELLADDATNEQVADAAATYARRQAAAAMVLAEHGIDVGHVDGINTWIPVDDERATLVSLAARGIGVAPGGPFVVLAESGHHVRATIGIVGGSLDDMRAVFTEIAVAATTGAPRGRHR